MHYICTGGCHGVSDHSGVCSDSECAQFEHSLEECTCTDGEHHGAFAETEEPDEESTVS